MSCTQTELLTIVRSMARQGSKPSEMLRALLSHCGSEDAGDSVDRNSLVQYFSEAFYFSDGQAYPIFGWFPDESGELKDSGINYLLAKRIDQARDEWEKAS
jgi:hypothetical protein